jgi:Zn-dependent membrane protease YugP
MRKKYKIANNLWGKISYVLMIPGMVFIVLAILIGTILMLPGVAFAALTDGLREDV